MLNGWFRRSVSCVRLLVCCDSFKGSLAAEDVCAEIARTLRSGDPSLGVFSLPLADGGEGTMGVIARALGLSQETLVVTGPLGQLVESSVAWGRGADFPCLGARADTKVALLEIASCAGLVQVPIDERDPMRTTSYGLGELLCRTAERGANAVVLGLGGSATVDGGLGMLQAIGANLSGAERPASGRDLLRLLGVELTALRTDVAAMDITVACDVNNPLLGARGAVRAFGPQKGASPDAVERLESAMGRYAVLMKAAAKRRDGVTAMNRPGAGAAGGLGYALEMALGARLMSGIEIVMELTRFSERLCEADAVVTGEGCVDGSSFDGKVLSGVLNCARLRGLPVHVIAGCTTLSEREWRARGIASVTCLEDFAASRDDAQARAQTLVPIAVRTLKERLSSLP